MAEKNDCDSCGAVISKGERFKYLSRTDAEMDADTLEERWAWEQAIICMDTYTKWTCGECQHVSWTMRISFRSLVYLTLGNPGKAEFMEEEAQNEKSAAAAKRWATRRSKEEVVTASADFARIVGEGEILRTDAVSKFWGYIRERSLQNVEKWSQINADELLRPVFGASSVAYSEIPNILDKHLMTVDGKGCLL